jgi:O6-methylguanine-DNA--protein-cysteine methyltransferase
MKTSICFAHCPSPLGPMILAADGDALIGAWFDGQRHQPPIGGHWQHRPEHPLLRRAIAQFSAYFAGSRTRFELALAPAGTPFQHAVWQAPMPSAPRPPQRAAIPCRSSFPAIGSLARMER